MHGTEIEIILWAVFKALILFCKILFLTETKRQTETLAQPLI